MAREQTAAHFDRTQHGAGKIVTKAIEFGTHKIIIKRGIMRHKYSIGGDVENAASNLGESGRTRDHFIGDSGQLLIFRQ